MEIHFCYLFSVDEFLLLRVMCNRSVRSGWVSIYLSFIGQRLYIDTEWSKTILSLTCVLQVCYKQFPSPTKGIVYKLTVGNCCWTYNDTNDNGTEILSPKSRFCAITARAHRTKLEYAPRITEVLGNCRTWALHQAFVEALMRISNVWQRFVINYCDISGWSWGISDEDFQNEAQELTSR